MSHKSVGSSIMNPKFLLPSFNSYPTIHGQSCFIYLGKKKYQASYHFIHKDFSLYIFKRQTLSFLKQKCKINTYIYIYIYIYI